MKLDPTTVKVIIACVILTIIFSLIMRHIMEKNGVYDPPPEPRGRIERSIKGEDIKK